MSKLIKVYLHEFKTIIRDHPFKYVVHKEILFLNTDQKSYAVQRSCSKNEKNIYINIVAM